MCAEEGGKSRRPPFLAVSFTPMSFFLAGVHAFASKASLSAMM